MKRIISLILVIVLAVSCFSGCTAKEKPIKPTHPAVEEPITKDPTTKPTEKVDEPDVTDPVSPPVLEDVGGVGFNQFETDFITYLNQEHGSENYMTSTTSLKMALALAAAGANDNTLDEMLNVVGYETLEEYLAWAESMLQFEQDADLFFASMENASWTEGYDGEFSIANGMWHNSDQAGEFLESYLNRVKALNAEVDNLPGDELKDAINTWINDRTNGLISEMFSSPLNEYSTILVNTIYMKNYWAIPFSEHLTHDGDFTTIDGGIVTKELMEQTDKFEYYDDENCQVVILDMDHDFKMAVVLGDNTNIVSKLNQAEYREVHVVLPKFEIESSFDNEISEYLQEAGMVDAFVDGIAAFDRLTSVGMFIEKIMQKTKIAVDENGLEAAAATAILMENDSCAPEEPTIPIDFIADEPFTFYIYAESNCLVGPELLFYGQYVK